MCHCLNEYIHKKNIKKWEPKLYIPLNPVIKDLFKPSGEGLYNIALQGKKNNIVSKFIQLFSGKFTHIITVVYNENIKNKMSSDEWSRVVNKFGVYYGKITSNQKMTDIYTNDFIKEFEQQIVESCKIMVLGSADEIGMNYFDFSHYERREFVIIKPNLDSNQEDAIFHEFLTEESMNKIYDFTGLGFWWLFRAFDDKEAWYCSEQLTEIFEKYNYKLSDKNEPSPTQQVEYAEKNNLIIYRNDGE